MAEIENFCHFSEKTAFENILALCYLSSPKKSVRFFFLNFDRFTENYLFIYNKVEDQSWRFLYPLKTYFFKKMMFIFSYIDIENACHWTLQTFDETFTLLLHPRLTWKYYIYLQVFAYWFLTRNLARTKNLVDSWHRQSIAGYTKFNFLREG